jgi:tetrathionate reductase subunit B
MSAEKHDLTRKEFLSLSAAAAGAALVSAAGGVRAAQTKKPRWAMVMDVRRCIGCHACTVACKAENDVPLGVWRTHIRTHERGHYPHAKRFFFPWICNHCGNCAEASQGAGLGSFYRREDGIVLFDYKKLQGKTVAQIKTEADLVISACPLEAIT